MTPATRYARSGDLSIAYQVVGSGPLDIVFVHGFVSHLDMAWETPTLGPIFQRLASVGLVLTAESASCAGTSSPALVASPSLVDEVREVLGRPKLAPRIARIATTVGELMESLLADLEVIAQPAVEPVAAADPDDDHVLACALAGNARYIVSGDRHLLNLKDYKGISILKPAAALAKPEIPPQAATP